jgi:hypothetical protein
MKQETNRPNDPQRLEDEEDIMRLEDHCIHTGSDGELDGTTIEQLTELVARLGDQKKVVIHLHGGLVSAKKALAKAEELVPEYLDSGVYPVFFIYRTGLLEIVRNNLDEIFRERIFKILLRKLSKFVVGKLTTIGGSKAAGELQLPRDLTIAMELKKAESKIEPFAWLPSAESLDEVTEIEERLLTDALASDIDFQQEVQAVVNGATPDQEMEVHSKGATTIHRISSETLMSPDVVDELVEDASKKDAKGLFSSAKIIVRAVKIFKRVISRTINDRDHGPYATVIEEILRELYIANVGALIWGLMKQETLDTFRPSPSGSVRGGRAFVFQLGKMLKETGANPEISVVAHSLGSVFACNLINHVAEARDDPNHPLPDGFSLKNLIFLAPAAEHQVFADTLSRHSSVFRNFRMFALSDELERGYWEIPAIYPRSLLYLVSGVVEKRDDGKSAFDRPLVGMQRYLNDTNTYNEQEVQAVRTFLERSQDSCVWSIAEGQGAGLESNAVRHGGFDDTVADDGSPAPRKTMDSVLHILGKGMK